MKLIKKDAKGQTVKTYKTKAEMLADVDVQIEYFSGDLKKADFPIMLYNSHGDYMTDTVCGSVVRV